MRGLKLFAAFAAATILSAQAKAEPKGYMSARWTLIKGDSPSAEPRLVLDGEMVLRNKLLPTALAVLMDGLQQESPKNLSVAAGAQLFAVSSTAGDVIFCAFDTIGESKGNLLVKAVKGTTLCFMDNDRNGRFESYFKAAAGEGLPQIQGAVPKVKNRIPTDLAYENLPVEQTKADLWVGIKYEQYFNIYGNRMFMIAFGGRGKEQQLTEFEKFKSAGPFPMTVNVLGAKLTVVSVETNGSRIRVDQPISIPEFGVVTQTSYTFY